MGVHPTHILEKKLYLNCYRNLTTNLGKYETIHHATFRTTIFEL